MSPPSSTGSLKQHEVKFWRVSGIMGSFPWAVDGSGLKEGLAQTEVSISFQHRGRNWGNQVGCNGRSSLALRWWQKGWSSQVSPHQQVSPSPECLQRGDSSSSLGSLSSARTLSWKVLPQFLLLHHQLCHTLSPSTAGL